MQCYTVMSSPFGVGLPPSWPSQLPGRPVVSVPVSARCVAEPHAHRPQVTFIPSLGCRDNWVCGRRDLEQLLGEHVRPALAEGSGYRAQRETDRLACKTSPASRALLPFAEINKNHQLQICVSLQRGETPAIPGKSDPLLHGVKRDAALQCDILITEFSRCDSLINMLGEPSALINGEEALSNPALAEQPASLWRWAWNLAPQASGCRPGGLRVRLRLSVSYG